jgi:hypothetical protein
MYDYVEIENPHEIARLNKELAGHLTKKFPFTERRTIGHPQESFVARVYFKRSRGENVFWWSPGQRRGVNFFGHGMPGSERGLNRALNIDIQFNLPVAEFSRRLGGLFLRHIRTNSIVLAHRGHITLGHARVKKELLFQEINATLHEAETSKGCMEFLLIGELESKNLVDDIESFALESRRAAKAVKDRGANAPTKAKRGPVGGFAKLREYFDEFWGPRKSGRRYSTISDCDHGKVVRALRNRLAPHCEQIQKSREVDLVAQWRRHTYLFEVKTSTVPQAIYTAVGQLFVHTQALANRDMKVKPVIVLPGEPHAQLRDVLLNGLGIGVVSFALKQRKSVEFDGLSALMHASP